MSENISSYEIMVETKPVSKNISIVKNVNAIKIDTIKKNVINGIDYVDEKSISFFKGKNIKIIGHFKDNGGLHKIIFISPHDKLLICGAFDIFDNLVDVEGPTFTEFLGEITQLFVV